MYISSKEILLTGYPINSSTINAINISRSVSKEGHNFVNNNDETNPSKKTNQKCKQSANLSSKT
jgi:hypothetical protein